MSTKDDNKEALRLEELKKFDILDTPSESAYNDIVYLAAEMCKMPIALMSLVDKNRQWFKACVGLSLTETPREVAFCNHVVRDGVPLIIDDTHQDDRFKNHPLVLSHKVRFYAGFPLISNGFILGTLCVLDFKPRTINVHQRRTLSALARQLMHQLELRLALKNLNEAQEQVKKENERYASLVRSLREIVFQTDSYGKISYLSPAWVEITGYKVEEALGNQLSDYIWSDDRLLNLEKFHSLLSKEEAESRYQLRAKTKDGLIRWLEVFLQVTYSEDGQVSGVNGTLSDITEKYHKDRLIEEQRAKMIHSARLYSLGEMAAGIAHEINNPLAIIRGTAQILGKNLNNEDFEISQAKDSLLKIDTTVGRISKIISGLKSFAREGGKDPYTLVQVKSIISDALELCQTKFKNNGVVIDLENTESDVQIECRPVQVAQVLLNLLSNAFDAISGSSVKQIKIHLIELEDSVEIKVLDSGPGIPFYLKDRIMEPFFSTKGPNRGMGLGLSLSKGLIETHNGSLQCGVENNLTCFTMCLPKKQMLANKFSA